MNSIFRSVGFVILGFSLAACAWGESSPDHTTAEPQKPSQSQVELRETHQKEKPNRGPGKETGKGGEDIGVGVAKGTRDLAKGTAGGVGHLARGNVGSAGASFGKRVVGFGKNVGVGTGKGGGGEFKKLGGKSKDKV
jgi:hypothetical protein